MVVNAAGDLVQIARREACAVNLDFGYVRQAATPFKRFNRGEQTSRVDAFADVLDLLCDLAAHHRCGNVGRCLNHDLPFGRLVEQENHDAGFLCPVRRTPRFRAVFFHRFRSHGHREFTARRTGVPSTNLAARLTTDLLIKEVEALFDMLCIDPHWVALLHFLLRDEPPLSDLLATIRSAAAPSSNDAPHLALSQFVPVCCTTRLSRFADLDAGATAAHSMALAYALGWIRV